MKTLVLFFVLAVASCIFADRRPAASLPDEARRKQKEEESLTKHLALMEELEREAETAGWKRPVPPPPPRPAHDSRRNIMKALPLSGWNASG